MLKYLACGNFPVGLVVKTLPSSAGGGGSIPGQGAEIPHASRPKTQNIKQKQTVTNSIKTLKWSTHTHKS